MISSVSSAHWRRNVSRSHCSGGAPSGCLMIVALADRRRRCGVGALRRARTGKRQHGRDDQEPLVRHGNIMILMAQTVPTATSVPCVANLPAGWEVGGAEVESDEGRFWLDSAIAGKAGGRGGVAAAGGVHHRRGDRGAERRGRHAPVRAP